MKFKVGDKVKVLPSAVNIGVDKSDVGKIGVIFEIESPESILIKTTYTENWFWCVYPKDIVPVIKVGQQLIFSFMEDI